MITAFDDLREIQHRDHIPEFLNKYGLTGNAAELGTYLGDFAETLLKTWSGKRLNLVDPYRHYQAGEYVDGTAIDHATGRPVDFEIVFWRAHARLNPYPAAYFIRKTSAEAVTMFEDGSLDFVYVDANHSFEHVTEDLKLWWPKLAAGGLMGLHDCYQHSDSRLNCGVFDAMWDFSESIKQRPRLTLCTTAWFAKL